MNDVSFVNNEDISANQKKLFASISQETHALASTGSEIRIFDINHVADADTESEAQDIKLLQISSEKFSTDDAKSEWDAKNIYPQSADEDLHDIYLNKKYAHNQPMGVSFVQGDDETKSIHAPYSNPDE
jgi:adenine deaminase